MSKKHFVKLARIIHEAPDHDERTRLANLIGDMCADDNENFDWSRWWKACGV